MKIVKHGAVTFTEGPVRVEGWVVERELTDPPLSEATNEQLVLEVAIPWAQKKLNEAIMTNLRRISKEKKAQNPTMLNPLGKNREELRPGSLISDKELGVN
jgi:hypothetical protein